MGERAPDPKDRLIDLNPSEAGDAGPVRRRRGDRRHRRMPGSQDRLSGCLPQHGDQRGIIRAHVEVAGALANVEQNGARSISRSAS